MEFLKRRETISLVVLCSIKPVFIHNRWMLDRSIITHEEFLQGKDKPLTVGANVSAFTVGQSISVYCDKSRIQIESTDITTCQRIVDICTNTLQMSEVSKYDAVGINSDMDFIFTNEDDAFRFGNEFIPLKNWEGYLDTPRVGSFTIQENHEATLEKPRRAINIQSLGAEKKGGGTTVRISVNNHYPIKFFDEYQVAVKNAQSQYDAFGEWYENLFSEFFK